jgi:hypothetical protein
MTKLAWDPYCFSELLINYKGGVVRRGLLGTLILAYSKGSSALPFTNCLLFGNYIVLLLSMMLLTFRKARFRIWNAVLVLIIPGGLFAAVSWNEYFARKEMFFYSALTVSALAISLVQSVKHDTLRRIAAYCIIGFIGASSVLLMLVHEAFIFLAAPANLFLIIAAARAAGTSSARPRRADAIIKGMAYVYIGTLALLFVCTMLFHGDNAAKMQIWNGLSRTDRMIISSDGMAKGGIAFINMSIGQQLRMPVHVLLSGFGWYWLGAFVMLMMYCLTLVALNIEDTSEDKCQELYRWGSCYLTLVMFAVPIFLITADWGRRIASINFSFLVLWLSVAPQNLAQVAMNRLPQRLIRRTRLDGLSSRLRGISVNYASFVVRHRRALIATMLVFAMTFRLPEWRFDDRSDYILARGLHAGIRIVHYSFMLLH